MRNDIGSQVTWPQSVMPAKRKESVATKHGGRGRGRGRNAEPTQQPSTTDVVSPVNPLFNAHAQHYMRLGKALELINDTEPFTHVSSATALTVKDGGTQAPFSQAECAASINNSGISVVL